MKHKVHMVVGVPGAGKTWVCDQIKEQYQYVPHDKYIGNETLYHEVITRAAALGPVVTECPFAEREMREALVKRGAQVNPVFIVEDPKVVAARYAHRTGNPISKSNLTRAVSIADRAKEWNAFSGTSDQVLAHLKESK